MHRQVSKTILTIAITFAATFVLAIAVSEGLAASNTAAPTPVGQTDELPRSPSLITPTDHPVTETLDTTVHSSPPGYVFLPIENVELPDPLKDRKEFLQAYLSNKNSVLADHVDALSEQTQWKLIIAISRAESSFCKRHEANNCWGIGGAWNMKQYKSYDEAIADVNRILEQHYIQAGLSTPKTMVKKWVGHNSKTWEAAVQQELDALANVQ